MWAAALIHFGRRGRIITYPPLLYQVRFLVTYEAGMLKGKGC